MAYRGTPRAFAIYTEACHRRAPTVFTHCTSALPVSLQIRPRSFSISASLSYRPDCRLSPGNFTPHAPASGPLPMPPPAPIGPGQVRPARSPRSDAAGALGESRRDLTRTCSEFASGSYSASSAVGTRQCRRGLLLSVGRLGQRRTIVEIYSSSSAKAFARHRPVYDQGRYSIHVCALPHVAARRRFAWLSTGRTI